MKNSSFPARMLSLLLAVAVLFGLASPAGAAASSNTLRYQQVDNSSVSANLLHPADQETDEAPQYADTDIVRVSIVLEKASTLNPKFFQNYPLGLKSSKKGVLFWKSGKIGLAFFAGV